MKTKYKNTEKYNLTSLTHQPTEDILLLELHKNRKIITIIKL